MGIVEYKSPVIILEQFGHFTKGEIYEVLEMDNSGNVYVEDDEERYCILEIGDYKKAWRNATDEELFEQGHRELRGFWDYQARARTTAIYPQQGEIIGLLYTTLGLNGEVGEIAEKIKKLLRDKNSTIDIKFKEDMEKELGDVLWYLANLASELGLDLHVIAKNNLHKLYSRKERGKLHGEGDNR